MAVEIFSQRLSPGAQLNGNSLLETTPRQAAVATQALTSQRIQWGYLTPAVTTLATNVSAATGGTAAATITLIRFGIYTVATNGDLALVASTANDVTLFTATATLYTKALSSPFTLNGGQRYAVGVLVVATTAPSLYCSNGLGGINALAPRLAGHQSGQTDLPASTPAGSVANNGIIPWLALT